jgi:alginate O-acetyltransferase complex protein AlgI
MLFNSLQFLIFFPVVTLLYFLFPHRFRWLLLLMASCVFYCAFYPPYILILFFTIAVDYIAGIYIEKSTGRRRKQFLIVSIAANVGVLAVFKYFNFFLNNYNHVLHGLHIHGYDAGFWNILLPIGLSFHTFQAMSYTIEVYKGNQKAERHLGIYALYVMFYPQLVAGPIERPQHLLPQFSERHFFDLDNLWWGVRMMLWGLFKTAVIADRLDVYVNAIFNHTNAYHPGNVLLGAVFFAFQIYCDFSGYSDIAIGAARVMGFDLMSNFDRPYLSADIATFWRKWHISLSSWFRDYIYIPLGGNRVSPLRRNFNLLITFLLSGLWHGASWTFIAWGLIHGVYMMIYENGKRFFAVPNFGFISKAIGAIFTFSIVTVAWVFFRAASIGEALHFLKYTISPSRFSYFEFPTINEVAFAGGWHLFVALLFVFLLVSEEILGKNKGRFTGFILADSLWLGAVMFLVLTMGIYNQNAFIYFQF